MGKECFLKSFLKEFFFFWCFLQQNYLNAEMDKTENQMNLKTRTLSTEIEYYQKIWNIYKKNK